MSQIMIDEIKQSSKATPLSNTSAEAHIESSRELTPTEAAADKVGLDAIQETALPHPADQIDPKTVTDEPAASAKILEVAAKSSLVREANPSLEGINAALRYQSLAIAQLGNAELETNKHLEAIDNLLDLSAELATLSSEDKLELTEKMQLILSQLKEKGIDLLKSDITQISKEQLIELKSRIGSQIDQARTKVQQIFTKMQNFIQNIMSVNDSAKRFLNEFIQMIRTILRNMRPG